MNDHPSLKQAILDLYVFGRVSFREVKATELREIQRTLTSAANDFRASVGPDALLRLLDGKAALPRRAVVLNFSPDAPGTTIVRDLALEGLALEEVGEDWLESYDPSYPLVIAVRARRPDEGG